MAVASAGQPAAIDDKTYRQRIRAWIFYDWANSAFVTTVLAALLPIYFSSVAGATLPSRAIATSYWSLTLSIALFFSAVMSPILGTISDITRGKKKFLAFFTAVGVVASALLVLVNTGDWVLAAILAVLGRIGLNGALVFYDALLPHVAKPEDQDKVSSQGYAFGYLGGGILLAINVAMVFVLPEQDNIGTRLSFLSVAVWWAIFAIPLLRQVPEPPAATETLKPGETVIGASFKRLRQTLAHIRQYRQLFLYLIAYLIYNDGIGTIISLAAVYGTELGFGTIELVLALLLVQFVGMPFALIFGNLPRRTDGTDTNQRRPFLLAFILFNAVMLPIAGIILSRVLPIDISGQAPAPYETTSSHFGEGEYFVDNAAIVRSGAWTDNRIDGEALVSDGILASLAGIPADVVYAVTDEVGAKLDFNLNGQAIEITYAVGPNNGTLGIEVDGAPLTETIQENDQDIERPITIDTYNPTVRYGDTATITLAAPGQYTVSLINLSAKNTDSLGSVLAIAEVKVLPPIRVNSLPIILGLLLAMQGIGLIFAFIAQRFFVGLANTLDTRRSILLSLGIYSIIATWGFFLNSTVEYWFLAWMVAIVQGGSQALSRSLYASLTPASKSGEFFGLFSIMEKFASIIGPLLFAFAAATLGSSRPAILSLIALFVIGGYLLTRVNLEEGQKAALEEDAEVFGTA